MPARQHTPGPTAAIITQWCSLVEAKWQYDVTGGRFACGITLSFSDQNAKRRRVVPRPRCEPRLLLLSLDFLWVQCIQTDPHHARSPIMIRNHMCFGALTDAYGDPTVTPDKVR